MWTYGAVRCRDDQRGADHRGARRDRPHGQLGRRLGRAVLVQWPRRHRLVACASLAEIAVNVTLSILLVQRYGLTGVAIGTAVPYTVIN